MLLVGLAGRPAAAVETMILARGESAIGWPQAPIVLSANLAWAGIAEATLAALAVLAGGLAAAWLAVGREPRARAIEPQFVPPPGLSAGACRHLCRKSYDSRTLAAGLLGLAARGAVRIWREAGGTFWIAVQPRAPVPLDRPEERLLQRLPTPPTRLDRPPLRTPAFYPERSDRWLDGPLRAAQTGYVAALRDAHLGTLFCNNRGALCGLAALALGLGGWLWSVAGEHRVAPSAIVQMCLSVGMSLMVAGILASFGGLSITPGTGRNRLQQYGSAVAAGGLSLAVGVEVIGVPLTCFAMAAGGLLLVAWYILPRRTVAGQRLFEAIEGFRRFLSLAEGERLDALHPPEITPALFYRFLPFALALDVAHPWSARCAAAVAAGAVAPASVEGSFEIDWTASDAILCCTEQLDGWVRGVDTATAPDLSFGDGSG